MPDAPILSPTISANELEIFYTEYPVGSTGGVFRRAVRGSKADGFGPGAPVPSLDAACEPAQRRTMALSADALRAYLVCYADQTMDSSGTLRFAARSIVDAEFELDPRGFGTVGASASVSDDELELVSSARTTTMGDDPPEIYRRQIQSEPFAAGSPILGLEASGITAPDLGPGSLFLVGGRDGSIVATERADRSGAFGTPTVVIEGSPESPVLGAPGLSADCRSIYFVRADSMPETPSVVWSFHTASR